MVRVEELFKVKYGVNLELNKLRICSPMNKNSVNFVARTSKNNGVVATVEKIAGIEPIPEGTISVAGGGSVMESFLQPKSYYSGRDLYYLTSLVELTDEQKLYYCFCLQGNKYRYNYGRQANRTLKKILVPEPSEIPSWVCTERITEYKGFADSLDDSTLDFDPREWHNFSYHDLFVIKKGKRLTKIELSEGVTPFLGAIDSNNGIRQYVDVVPLHLANTITVNYNGCGVGEAFYQEAPFWASDDVNVLYPKFDLNKYIAMFLITLIRQGKYRFNYGRKWHKERMESSIIKLPINLNGEPDFEFMERYIKSIPFSASI
jgi:hypothetical protein